jgi:hypothetical protein
MKHFLTPVLMTISLIFSICNEASATLYCGRTYSEMTPELGYPYSAVGYLNNGCTAFLIDRNHIVTAAHCLVTTRDGAWQTNLRFYPDFHPSRVTNDEDHVPRADVIRAVVGSRAGESVLGDGMDWAIAYVDNWRDIAGMDLTPLPLASKVPPVGSALINPSYTRHHFPYNDQSAPHWDDMQRDYCEIIDHNMWAIKPGKPPKHSGTAYEDVGCNQRWGPAFVHTGGSIKSTTGAVIRHNVDTIGGSSGSPLLFANNGKWEVVGVGHGGGETNFAVLEPTCTKDVPANHNNTGASVERFRNAPRFASNVAVHRVPKKRGATAVFAIDSDLDQVVYRYREGQSPTYTSQFSYWRTLGRPSSGVQLTKIAACSIYQANPQVFVLDSKGEVYTRAASASGFWTAWTKHVASGSLVDIVTDIDTSTNSDGQCQLFITRSASGLYTSSKNANGWSSWQKIASGQFFNVSAIRTHQNVLMAAVIDKFGKLWRTAFLMTGWQTPTQVGLPSGYSALRDIDFTWDESGRAFMVALPTKATNGRLYFLPLYGDGAWRNWRFFTTSLWAPGQPPQPAPKMLTITASRWMEDKSGITSPVIFATGDEGNVYFVEYSQLGSPGWRLTWKSFYHETIHD